jgi:hypothetical protein
VRHSRLRKQDRWWCAYGIIWHYHEGWPSYVDHHHNLGDRRSDAGGCTRRAPQEAPVGEIQIECQQNPCLACRGLEYGRIILASQPFFNYVRGVVPQVAQAGCQAGGHVLVQFELQTV